MVTIKEIIDIDASHDNRMVGEAIQSKILFFFSNVPISLKFCKIDIPKG